MTAIVTNFFLLQIAGVLHLLAASANFFAPRKLHYAENLRRVSPIIKNIFTIQNIYIVIFLISLAGLCFFFGNDLLGGSVLGRCLSGFLGVFWSLRVLLQLYYFDKDVRRQFPVFDKLFLIAYSYLAVLFTSLVVFPSH